MIAAGLEGLEQLNVAIAIAAIGMDENDESEHAHSSKHARECGGESMLDMNNDDERKPKRTRNGKDEPAYYSRTLCTVQHYRKVSVPFSKCAYR